MSYTQGMKMSTMTILMNARVLYYTYDRGWLLFKSGSYMLLTIYKCSFNDVYIFSLVFLSLKMCVYYLEHKKKLLYRGFLHYVAKHMWFLVSMKGTLLGNSSLSIREKPITLASDIRPLLNNVSVVANECQMVRPGGGGLFVGNLNGMHGWL